MPSVMASSYLYLAVLFLAVVRFSQSSLLPISVVTVVEAPYVTQTVNASGTFYGGILVDLLNYILAQASAQDSFGARVTAVPTYYATQFYGSLDVNSDTWNGAMGELVHGPANISACLMSITTQRLNDVSFVTPFMSTGTSVLTGMPHSHVSEWLWVQPFSPSVWAILLMVLVVTCTAVWAVDWCSPYGSRIKGANLEDKRLWNLPNTYYRTIQAMLEREVPGPGAWSSRFIMTGAFFTFVFFLAAYESGLTSLELAHQLQTGITSYLTIQQSQIPFATIANSSVSSFIRSNPLHSVRVMSKYMVEYPTMSEAVAAVSSGQLQAAIGPQNLLQYYAAQPPCDLQIVGDAMAVSFLAFALPKTANVDSAPPLLNQIVDQGVVRALEDGTMVNLISRYTPASSCGVTSTISATTSNIGTSISLQQYAGLFYLYAALLLLAWGTLAIEIKIYEPTPKGPWSRKWNKCCGATYEEPRLTAPRSIHPVQDGFRAWCRSLLRRGNTYTSKIPSWKPSPTHFRNPLRKHAPPSAAVASPNFEPVSSP